MILIVPVTCLYKKNPSTSSTFWIFLQTGVCRTRNIYNNEPSDQIEQWLRKFKLKMNGRLLDL